MLLVVSRQKSASGASSLWGCSAHRQHCPPQSCQSTKGTVGRAVGRQPIAWRRRTEPSEGKAGSESTRPKRLAGRWPIGSQTTWSAGALSQPQQSQPHHFRPLLHRPLQQIRQQSLCWALQAYHWQPARRQASAAVSAGTVRQAACSATQLKC